MTQLLSQILLSISLITTGLTLRCYKCIPNDTLISAGKSSCKPEPITCKNATHCLSMRRRISRNSERTYKDCAEKTRCVSAHTVCLKLMNSSQVENEECKAHCCEGDLCNLEVHKNESFDVYKGNGNGICLIPVPQTALMTSLLLMLLHLFGLT